LSNNVKFGTSGLRGPAQALLSGKAELYLAAFFEHIAASTRNPHVFVGRDLRDSSEALAAQTCAAAIASGFKPIYCGCVPTPALSYAAQLNDACAVMVTGSHIPSDRNGLKFYSPDGEITKDDEKAIEVRARNRRIIMSIGSNPEPAIIDYDTQASLFTNWHQRHVRLVDRDILRQMRIGVYIGSSVAANALQDLIQGLGGQVTAFGWNRVFCPLDTEAVDEKIFTICRQAITEHKLDAVISTDPDGDRPLVVDEMGNMIRGDFLGWNAAKWLGADHIITTITANSTIASLPGIALRRTRVGSPYVIEGICEALREGSQSPVGFEPNGGTLVGADMSVDGRHIDRLVTRDSFLPILAILCASATSQKPLSQLAADAAFNFGLSGRVVTSDFGSLTAWMKKILDDKTVFNHFFSRHGAIVDIDRMDGLRMTFIDRRIIHLRPSGNAPEMRCYVEAQTLKQAETLLSDCLASLSAVLKCSENRCITESARPDNSEFVPCS
jgi:phosphomannomutase